MLRKHFWLYAIAVFILSFLSTNLNAQVTIAQISDPHIGLARAPQGADQLRKVVQMVNQRNPDVVVVTGDIGERPAAWQEARDILKNLRAKVYYIPGNHDVHSTDVDRYRKVFGDDYYKFTVKNVTVYAIDSQLFGNWDKFDAKQEPSMPPETKAEGDKEIQWLEDNAQAPSKSSKEGGKKGRGKENSPPAAGNVVIAMQHVPAERDHGFPNDPKPYWVVNDPYRQREEAALKKLGVKDILAGHWHDARVFDAGGFTWHVAPSTSWSPFNGKLGFAMHTIGSDGRVKTQFVFLDGSTQ